MQTHLNRRVVRGASLFLGILLATQAAGCIAVVGGEHREARTPTLGQQLQDLKTARDNGAISELEYQNARNKFLSEHAARP
ncbi:MAG TPA: hypothetical protein VHD56_17240 [Tepidisphaeraceae bacterium]|nr:hypothetical protein [Tepidisphaeraceae bacterium]